MGSRREREGRRGEGKGEKDVLRVLWFVFLRVVMRSQRTCIIPRDP